jgi:hypothetical protein
MNEKESYFEPDLVMDTLGDDLYDFDPGVDDIEDLCNVLRSRLEQFQNEGWVESFDIEDPDDENDDYLIKITWVEKQKDELIEKWLELTEDGDVNSHEEKIGPPKSERDKSDVKGVLF